MFENFKELVLDCIPKSRSVSEQELWERIVRKCKVVDVCPIFGQAKTSLKHLFDEGIIKKSGSGVIRVH